MVRLRTGSRGRMTVRDEEEVERLDRGITLRLPVVTSEEDEAPRLEVVRGTTVLTGTAERVALTVLDVERAGMGASD